MRLTQLSGKITFINAAESFRNTIQTMIKTAKIQMTGFSMKLRQFTETQSSQMLAELILKIISLQLAQLLKVAQFQFHIFQETH